MMLMARLIQQTLQSAKLVSVPVLVQNKAGGNQNLAPVYIKPAQGGPALPAVLDGDDFHQRDRRAFEAEILRSFPRLHCCWSITPW